MRFGELDDGMCTVRCFLGSVLRLAWCWFDGGQAMSVELTDASTHNRHAFCRKEACLQLRIRTVAADVPAGRHHAVIGKARHLQTPHQVAHRSGRARPARRRGDVTICRHSAGRDSSNRLNHPPGKTGNVPRGLRRHLRYRFSPSDSTRPVARSRLTPVNHANVGAMSAGVAAVL